MWNFLYDLCVIIQMILVMLLLVRGRAEHICTRRLMHGIRPVLVVLWCCGYIWFCVPPVFNRNAFTNKLNTTVLSGVSLQARDKMINCRPSLFLLSISQ